MATPKVVPLRPKGIWMYLKSSKVLSELMDEREVSQRQLAAIAGYASHSYIARLQKGDVRTLDTDPALRIAHFFGVPVNYLFATKVDDSTNSPHNDAPAMSEVSTNRGGKGQSGKHSRKEAA